MNRPGAIVTALWLVPALAAAESAGHGHGALHLREILTGEHSITLWGAVVNFALLVLILYKAGSKPLQAFLTTRRGAMEQAMREAGEAKARAEARYQEYTQRLAGLDRELMKLKSDIERAAEEDKQRILADAEEASARLRRDTETLVRQHAEALERQVRAEVVAAAVTTAERVLRESIGPDDQRRLADAYRERMTQLASEKVS